MDALKRPPMVLSTLILEAASVTTKIRGCRWQKLRRTVRCRISFGME
jgi:hypothetical protein